MSFRSAFLLGDEFTIQEARYLSRGVKIEDWCSVGLARIGESEPRGALAVPLPGSLSGGDAAPCFYCGLNNHQAKQCPSKSLAAPRPAAWERLGQVDLGRLEALSQSLETALAKDPVTAMTARAASPHTLRKTGMPRRPVSMRRVSASTPAPNRAKAALAWATVSRGWRILSWSTV